jgi:uncharacterized phiE125 gp8 family phage protein
MRLRLVTAPTETPISLDEAKAHVRETTTDRDAELTAMVAAATTQLDGRAGLLGRALVTQTWEMLLDGFPCGDTIEVPLPPLQSIASITYTDTQGATQTLATSVYGVDASCEPGVVHLKYGQAWPATRDERNAVVIRFVAGYGTATAVPERLKSALKLVVADLDANREGGGELSEGLLALLSTLRVRG